MLKIEYVTDMPEFFQYNKGGKWKELKDVCKELSVGQVIRVPLENKRDAQSAQSAIQGSSGNGKGAKYSLRSLGLYFSTRTRPIDPSRLDGRWHIFVRRIEKPARD